MKNTTNGNMGRVIQRMKQGTANYYIITTLIVIGLICLPSCKKDVSPAPDKAPQVKIEPVNKVYERGPVRLELDITPPEITIADRLTLSMTVVADEAVEIEFPPFGEKLEQFGVVDYNTTLPELVDKNKKKIRRTYILEPFLSGDYTIPPLKVRFHMKDEKTDESHEIETEPVTINVKSLLPEKMAELKIHDIKPPVAYPPSYKVWAWSGGILAVFILAGIVTFIVIRKRRLAAGARAVRETQPHEIAFSELEALVNEHLIEKNEVKVFYQRITDIFRRYIENRFGIKAPELTTEEFMGNLRNHSAFTARQNEFLNEFLRHCDLVKFAEHRPETGDIQKTFDTCKNFILETRISKDEIATKAQRHKE